MYRFILFILLLSTNSFAGFCDSAGSKHKLQDIFVFGDRAYIALNGSELTSSKDAQECTHRNQFALELSDDNKSSIYPLLMAALVAKKDVRLMYCGGCVTHNYHGPSVTVPLVTSVRVYE